MQELTSIFDIIGPVMIGPSSSHTAGAVKIGLITRQLLGEKPVEARITLYNSFAKTYKGHGTDRAILGGILGFRTDDGRIRRSLEIAESEGLKVDFTIIPSAARQHPNTAEINLTGETGRNIDILGVSLGGGRIEIQEIEGFKTNFGAKMPTIIIIAKDIPGTLAKISKAIALKDMNIANMSVTRKEKMANIVIEVDHDIPQELIDEITLFKWVMFIKTVYPV